MISFFFFGVQKVYRIYLSKVMRLRLYENRKKYVNVLFQIIFVAV